MIIRYDREIGPGSELPTEGEVFKMVSGIQIDEIAVGTGVEVERGRMVSILWKGTLNRGDSFGE